MGVLLQDLVYALRQLRKTPGFTATVLLTLALGIGANAAIFTLVNSVLLSNLPVADPKTLIRIGDRDDCCVNTGLRDDGDMSLFSTETYYLLKKNLTEFEELTAMESGFGWRPLTVRRDGPQTLGKSVMGTFVSGNYFRVFGLRPAAGRLFTDGDDQPGAAFTAVMSYDTWKGDFGGDPSVIGSTFWIDTKPVTIIGMAPQGFYGDRISTHPPKYYLPLESMDKVLGAPYLHEAETQWAYVIGRVKPGVSLPALQQKASALLQQQVATFKIYQGPRDKAAAARAHVVLTRGGGGIQNMQDNYKDRLHLLTWIAALVLLVACANEGLALMFAEFVNRADIRMILRGSSAGFLFKTFQRFRVLAKLPGQEFQRNTATQLQVLCFVHNPHAPTTKDIQYSIMGNLTAEQVGARRGLWPGSTLCMRHIPDGCYKSVAALGQRFDVFSTAIPLA
jgi:macrolide transport system ATP-binding/permease protein